MSEHRYELLFESNPQPTFVFELDTLSFLAVNEAAVNTYGFQTDEFLNLKLAALDAAQDINEVLALAYTAERYPRRNIDARTGSIRCRTLITEDRLGRPACGPVAGRRHYRSLHTNGAIGVRTP